MIIIKEATEVDSALWDAYVDGQSAPIYFRYGWRSVFERAYGLKSLYLCAVDNEQIVGILPAMVVPGLIKKSIVSLPFLCHGGVLGDLEDARTQLVLALQEKAGQRRISTMQIRSTKHLPGTSLFCDPENVALRFPLFADEEQTFRSLGHTARKHINKSLKYQFQTKIGKDQLDIFYRVYTRRMKELGTPCHSRKFWEQILQIFPQNSGIMTIWDNAKCLGGMFFVYSKETFSDVLAVALNEYRDQCAYYFLHWQAVRFAVQQQCRCFDFERSQIDSGTYRFKKQWGAIDHPLFYYSNNPQSISAAKKKYRVLIQLWQKQPLFLANAFGPLLRRIIP